MAWGSNTFCTQAPFRWAEPEDELFPHGALKSLVGTFGHSRQVLVAGGS